MDISIDKSWREDVTAALRGISELHESYPGDIAISSASAQLTYLLGLIDNVEKDDAALEEITLGYLAMYQLIDIISPDFAELLCGISDRVRRYVRQHDRRLKIDQ